MIAQIRHGRAPTKSRHQQPYRQGDLDSLCGPYAIINACRNACSSAGQVNKINWEDLFHCLIRALHTRGKASEVICYGIGNRLSDHCLTTAKAYLLRKHHLTLTTSKPWIGEKSLDLPAAFKALRKHVKRPGHSALLAMEKPNDGHWTVIKHIKHNIIALSDSYGRQPIQVQDFAYGAAGKANTKTKYQLDSTSLVLITVTPP